MIFQPYTEKRDHIRTPALSQISRGAHSSNFWKARYNAVLIFLCEPPFVAVTTVATFLPESSSIMICAAIVREHRIFAEFHVKNASLQRDFLQLDRFEVKFHLSENRYRFTLRSKFHTKQFHESNTEPPSGACASLTQTLKDNLLS